MEGKMYSNGNWVEATNGDRTDVINPATGAIVGSIPAGSRQDVKLSIDAADSAFKSWSKLTAMERSIPLYKAYEMLSERSDEIARIMTLEQGKPLTESRGEVLGAAEFLRWYSEEAKRTYGETIPAAVSNKRAMVIRQPVGVVAAITPWNFPASMITRKVAPALAAGCTVVIKPANYTPLTAVALFEVFEQAGFPPGVVNLVTGKGSEIGTEFLENSKVKKITFTGSTEVGKHLLKGAADQVKRVSMELGGHAPFLVFDDADIDLAVDACILSKFRNTGQTCISANRVYVQDTIIDTFAKKLADRVRTLKIGNGMEDGIEIGPLIDQDALAKVQHQISDAISKGAEIITGGKEWKESSLSGSYYEPTVINHVNETMEISFEETFGPVAPLIVFNTEDEVLQKANNVNYGLAAYAFTNDLSRTYRVAEALEYGIVGMNDPLPSIPQAPFGGWKESGLGREGGHYGMDQYLEMKYISMGLNS
ncbi:NAD-dependent succinate-semialdehyde dehydrogenase [Virgibacillus ndiopensis]|uniref:NAD-dependent succinate-semialdehyde dehydrogenase n=1 Tax=Virgibacillus ndiopensis TaxID=2004408 RepID=UPI001C3F4AA7|nr:NAD-dependent succinate-semialdehyde dehydrogenase [Virgibacillus ndiopensis]